jgi:hypothetical protein
MTFVQCSLYFSPFPQSLDGAIFLTRDIFGITTFSHKVMVIPKWADCQAISFPFLLPKWVPSPCQFGWMAAIFSQALALNLGDCVKFLPLFFPNHEYSTSSFTAITLIQDHLPFSCAISEVFCLLTEVSLLALSKVTSNGQFICKVHASHLPHSPFQTYNSCVEILSS